MFKLRAYLIVKLTTMAPNGLSALGVLGVKAEFFKISYLSQILSIFTISHKAEITDL